MIRLTLKDIGDSWYVNPNHISLSHFTLESFAGLEESKDV